MTYPEITYPPVKANDRNRVWIKFSLRSLMIVVTLLAIVLAFVAAPPVFAVVIIGSHLALTGILVASLKYGKGWLRAFSIGALIPHIVGYVVAVAFFQEGPVEVCVALCISFAVCTLVGLSSALMHGFIMRRNRVVAPPKLFKKWLSPE